MSGNLMILNPIIIPPLPKVIGLDIETNGVRPWIDDILVITLSLGDKTYVLETKNYSKERLTEIFERIKSSNVLVVGQNIKFDLSFIYCKYGVLLTRIWDTMLASQITTNGKPFRYSLPDIIERDLGTRVIESDIKKFYQTSFIGLKVESVFSKEQLEYAAQDVEYLIKLYKVQKERVVELGLENIMKLELKLLPVLLKMEVKGCRIDREAWSKAVTDYWEIERLNIVNDLDKELLSLSQSFKKINKRYLKPRKQESYKVYDLFGEAKDLTIETNSSFNYASSAQILELFSVCDQPLPTIKEGDVIKTSAGENALGLYITENPHTPLRKFIDLLLRFREYEKLISTYGSTFLDQLDDQDYIHTSYAQCFTKTGRLNSRSPNLQNIPATDIKKDGYDIRQYFIPDPGHLMITCDMQGAEVRIAADYSGDEKLLNSILIDEDLHSLLASKSYSIIFGKKIKVDKSDKEIEAGVFKFKSRTLRDTHKSVLFAKFYKGGAKRVYEVLSEYINMFHEENQMDVANKISKMIDKELPKLSKYLSSLIEEAQGSGQLRGNKLGRLRYFDENAYGEPANFPIQASNADAMKIALIKLDEYFTTNGYGRIVMTIHDEVVCSVIESKAEEAAEFIKKTMAESLGWFLNTIPGDAAVSIDKHWKK